MTIDDIDHALLELQRLTAAQLRQRYAATFGEAVHTGNKSWLSKRIAWRLQTIAEGDLSERARQRAATLARDADLRLTPPRHPYHPNPRGEPSIPSNADAAASQEATPPSGDNRLPPPGALLTRAFKGQSHEVKILMHGFEYQGQVFSSLSAVANKITGTHCNGFWFFQLGRYAQGGHA